MMTNIEQTAAEKALGLMLPTRRVESFHYTNLRTMLGTFDQVAQKPTDDETQALGGAFKRLASDASVIHFYDGYHFDRAEALPVGVTVKNGVPDFNPNDNLNETIALINKAHAQSGVEITVDQGAVIAQTIGLAHAHTGTAGTIAATRFAINIGEGAQARFIERQMGVSADQYLASSVTSLKLAAGAKLDYIIVQQTGAGAEYLARLNVELAENAELNIFMLNAGGKLVRQEINVVSRGENSNLDIKGVNLIGGDAHVDVTTVLSHEVPNTNSNQLFRNIMTGNGKGVFQGQIKVHQIAQKTDAKMACNTLVLSDDAAFYAKPELEIFADDVLCGHGATVTELDKNHLFYLMARGVTQRSARALLIEAFVDEVVEDLEDEALVEALESIIAAWLEKNG